MAIDNNKEYAFPVFGTQGGGLVRQEQDGTYTFVEVPDWMTGTRIGDPMPEEWGTIPANKAASQQWDDDYWGTPEDQAYLNAGFEEFFTLIGQKVGAGEISMEEVERFFPPTF